MNFYRNWIDKNEFEGFKSHADVKTMHDFTWGLTYLGIQGADENPYLAISKYTDYQLSNSKVFFTPPVLPPDKYKLSDNILSFPSSIETHVKDNNRVSMQYYPTKDKENVIIVVPHWNASKETYDRICIKLQKIGFTTLRVILPYHDIRGTREEESSTLMVSANIGLTIQAMQQSVRDILSSVNWLEYQGFKKIGIMGSSIGSCCGFIAACHDSRVSGFFGNLMSGYFGDVVWTGLSTRHIRQSFDYYNQNRQKGLELTQEMIRKSWMLNSPIAYVDKIKLFNPNLKQFIISGRFDTTFLFEFTKQILKAYDDQDINYKSAILPCGHYSLGKFWFQYIDAYYIYRFFKSLFK
jgi:hypothetical protein